MSLSPLARRGQRLTRGHLFRMGQVPSTVDNKHKALRDFYERMGKMKNKRTDWGEDRFIDWIVDLVNDPKWKKMSSVHTQAKALRTYMTHSKPLCNWGCAGPILITFDLVASQVTRF